MIDMYRVGQIVEWPVDKLPPLNLWNWSKVINEKDIKHWKEQGYDQPKQELGSRYNTGKPKWSLVPQSALLPMVAVLEYGAEKYAPHNWMKGLKVTEICESMKRHLDAFMEGETYDPESGRPHIGHIQCNALFLSWMLTNRPDLDDRAFKKE